MSPIPRNSALASPSVARPICSVIISAKNEASRLAGCFESLAAQRSRYPFEVILVDNASTDGTYSLARKMIAGNRALRKNFFVFRERKPGSSSARNFGAKKSRGQILLFTDADCRFEPNWVEEMARPLLEPSGDNDLPLAAVGGRTMSDFGAGAKPTFMEKYLDQLFDFWEADRLSAFPAFLPWAPTCNLAVKREVFEGLRGFDTSWRNAAYDVDFCWRLVLCGFVLGYAPAATVHHLRRHNIRGLLRQMENYAFYNQSLLSTYERVLGLPAVATRKERLAGRGRRAIELLAATRNPRQLGFRGLDLLSLASGLKGGLISRVRGPGSNASLDPLRRGETPEKLRHLLPRGYEHLHRDGWCYWKDSPAVNEDGDLVLFRPRLAERFRLNSTAWKIWEVKSERGQSEDAARALGQSEADHEVLNDIDQLTLELRTRRLLP
jgi:GT2 family glycosyltransferase